MKQYLNTPEEVIKALKEGKEVKNSCNWTYKLIDGIIVGYHREEEIWDINVIIYGKEVLYTEEADPLKIEVGKFYKTKGNKKAYVYHQYGNGLFRVVCEDCTYSYCVDEKGEYSSCPKVDKLDLVSPWEE